MGMFDNIKCEYLLPDTPKRIQESTLQTKDLVNLLDDYTITKEGRLIHHQCNWEITPEEERPYYGTEEWDKNPLFQIFGSMRRVPLEDVDTKYHGMLHIYTTDPDNHSVFYDYELKFTDGNLVDVKLIYKEYGDK